MVSRDAAAFVRRSSAKACGKLQMIQFVIPVEQSESSDSRKSIPYNLDCAAQAPGAQDSKKPTMSSASKEHVPLEHLSRTVDGEV